MSIHVIILIVELVIFDLFYYINGYWALYEGLPHITLTELLFKLFLKKIRLATFGTTSETTIGNLLLFTTLNKGVMLLPLITLITINIRSKQ